MDLPCPTAMLKALKRALLDAETGKHKAIPSLAEALELSCTILCMVDEAYARHIPAHDYVSLASELLNFLMLYSLVFLSSSQVSTKGGSSLKKSMGAKEIGSSSTAAAAAGRGAPPPLHSVVFGSGSGFSSSNGDAERPLFSDLPTKLPVLALRFTALIGQVAPTGCLAMANPKHGMVELFVTLLSNTIFLLENQEAAEELLKCIHMVTPHAHAELLAANAPMTLAALEPILGDAPLRKMCLTSLAEVYARAHRSEWPALEAATTMMLDNLWQRVEFHFPSSVATAAAPGAFSPSYSTASAASPPTTPSPPHTHTRRVMSGSFQAESSTTAPATSARRLTRDDHDILLGYVTCVGQLCDRVLTTPDMLQRALTFVEIITRVLTRLFHGSIALGWSTSGSGGNSSGASAINGGTSDPFNGAAHQLRFVALAPLLILYYTAPATVARVLIDGCVLGTVSTAAAHVLDQSTRAAVSGASVPLVAVTAGQGPTAAAPGSPLGEAPADGTGAHAQSGRARDSGRNNSTSTMARAATGNPMLGSLDRMHASSSSFGMYNINSSNRSNNSSSSHDDALGSALLASDSSSDIASNGVGEGLGGTQPGNAHGTTSVLQAAGTAGGSDADDAVVQAAAGTATDGVAAHQQSDVAFVTDERAIVPVLEFLLAVLPAAPRGLSTDDHMTLVLPVHTWSWSDDFHNRTLCGERICRLIDRAYSNFRRNALAAESRSAVTTLESSVLLVTLNTRRKIFVNLNAQEFVWDGAFFPHAMNRNPLSISYTHARQEGLVGRGAYGACSCLALSMKEKSRELDEGSDDDISRCTRKQRTKKKRRSSDRHGGGGGSRGYSPLQPPQRRATRVPVESASLAGHDTAGGSDTRNPIRSFVGNRSDSSSNTHRDDDSPASNDIVDSDSRLSTSDGSNNSRHGSRAGGGHGQRGGSAGRWGGGEARAYAQTPTTAVLFSRSAQGPRPPLAHTHRDGDAAGSSSSTQGQAEAGWAARLLGPIRHGQRTGVNIDHAMALLRGGDGGSIGRQLSWPTLQTAGTQDDDTDGLWDGSSDRQRRHGRRGRRAHFGGSRSSGGGGGGGSIFSCCGGGSGGIAASRGGGAATRSATDSHGDGITNNTTSVTVSRARGGLLSSAACLPPRPLRELFSDAREDALRATSTCAAFVTFEAVQAVLSGVVPAILSVVRCAAQPLVARHGSLLLLRSLAITAAFCCDSSRFAIPSSSTNLEGTVKGSNDSTQWRLAKGHTAQTRRVAEMLQAVAQPLVSALTYLLTTDEGTELPEAGLTSARSVFATIKDEDEYRDAVKNAGLDLRYTCHALSIKAERRVAAADALCILFRLNSVLSPLLASNGSSCRGGSGGSGGVVTGMRASCTKAGAALLPPTVVLQQQRILLVACTSRLVTVRSVRLSSTGPTDATSPSLIGDLASREGKLLQKAASEYRPCAYHPTRDALLWRYENAHGRLVHVLLHLTTNVGAVGSGGVATTAANSAIPRPISRLGRALHFRRGTGAGSGNSSGGGLALLGPWNATNNCNCNNNAPSLSDSVRTQATSGSGGGGNDNSNTYGISSDSHKGNDSRGGSEDYMVSDNPLLAPRRKGVGQDLSAAPLLPSAPKEASKAGTGRRWSEELPPQRPPLSDAAIESARSVLNVDEAATAWPLAAAATTATKSSAPSSSGGSTFEGTLAHALRARIAAFQHVQPAALRALLAFHAHLRNTHTDVRTAITEAPGVLRELAESVGAWVTAKRAAIDYAEVMPDNALELLSPNGVAAAGKARAAPSAAAKLTGPSLDGLSPAFREADALLHALRDTKLDRSTINSVLELVTELMGAVVERLGLAQARSPLRLALHLPSAHWQVAAAERTWQPFDDVMGGGLLVRLQPCAMSTMEPFSVLTVAPSAAPTADGATAATSVGNATNAVNPTPSAGAATRASDTGESDNEAEYGRSEEVRAQEGTRRSPGLNGRHSGVQVSPGKASTTKEKSSISASKNSSTSNESVSSSDPDLKELSCYVSINRSKREITICGQTHRYWDIVSVDDSYNREEVVVLPFSTVGTVERQVGQALIAMSVEDGNASRAGVPILMESIASSSRIYSPLMRDAMVQEDVRLARAAVLEAEYQRGFPSEAHAVPFFTRNRCEPPIVALMAGTESAQATYEMERDALVPPPLPLSPPARGVSGNMASGHTSGRLGGAAGVVVCGQPTPAFSSAEARSGRTRATAQAKRRTSHSPPCPPPPLHTPQQQQLQKPLSGSLSRTIGAGIISISSFYGSTTSVTPTSTASALYDSTSSRDGQHQPNGGLTRCYPRLDHHVLLLINGHPLLNPQMRLLDALLCYSPSARDLARLTDVLARRAPPTEDDCGSGGVHDNTAAAAMWDDVAGASSHGHRRHHYEPNRGSSSGAASWASSVAKAVRSSPFWQVRHNLQVVVLESPLARQSLRTYALCACSSNLQSALAERLPRWPSQPVPAAAGGKRHGTHDATLLGRPLALHISKGGSYSGAVGGPSLAFGEPWYDTSTCNAQQQAYPQLELSDDKEKGGSEVGAQHQALLASRRAFLHSRDANGILSSPCTIFHFLEFMHVHQLEPLDPALALLSHLMCILRAEGVDVPSLHGDQRRMSASLVHNLSSLTPAVTFSHLAQVVARNLVALKSVRGYLAVFALICFPHVFPFEVRTYALRLLTARRPTPGPVMLREAVRGVGFAARCTLAMLAASGRGGTGGNGGLTRGSDGTPPASSNVPLLADEVRMLSMSWPVNPAYSLKVNRANILAEGSALLRRLTDCPAALGFHFAGEQGIGLGPTLEFYELLAEAMANVQPPIWRTVAVDGGKRSTARLLYPCPTHHGADAAHHYETLGMLVGLLVVLGRTTSVRFHPLFLSALAGESLITASAQGGRGVMALLDPQLEMSLRQLESMTADELNASEMENVLPAPELPANRPVYLSPDGTPRLLTHANVGCYTQAVRTYYLHKLLMDCITHFRVGLSCFLDPYLLRLFSADELSVLFSGRIGKVWATPAAMAKDVVAAHGYTMHSRVVRDLVALVPSWDAAEQRRFLRFVTGASSIPVRGLPFPIKVVCRNVAAGADLGGVAAPAASTTNATAAGNVNSSFASNATQRSASPYQDEIDATLPTVSTCFHYLKLPEYSCQRVLEERLRYAMCESAGTYGLT